jgi:RHS repeat-associated protein
VPGWNLFSFQVTPESTDPAAVLAGISGSYAVVFGHDGTDWNGFEPGSGGGLTELLPNHGYWIYVTGAAELLLDGPLSEAPIDVPHGAFALIGVPGLAPLEVDELRVRYPAVRAVWVYAGDDIGWRLLDSAAPPYVNTLSHTAPGLGYWVAASDETVLREPPPAPGLIFSYHDDHLGSTNITTDSSGTLASETVYYPFGTPRHEYFAEAAGLDPHYRFGGKERDKESGLQYFEARYYAGGLGRFASVDPLLARNPQADPASPQNLNSYAYSLNNPLRYIDPTGRQPQGGTPPGRTDRYQPEYDEYGLEIPMRSFFVAAKEDILDPIETDVVQAFVAIPVLFGAMFLDGIPIVNGTVLPGVFGDVASGAEQERYRRQRRAAKEREEARKAEADVLEAQSRYWAETQEATEEESESQATFAGEGGYSQPQTYTCEPQDPHQGAGGESSVDPNASTSAAAAEAPRSEPPLEDD